MSENNINQTALSPEEEAKLRKMASRRSSFRIHLAIFLLANTFLWVVWYFLFMGKDDQTFLTAILFVLIVWLLAIILHYMIVYKWTGMSKEKELKVLKDNLLRQKEEIESLKSEIAGKNDKTEVDIVENTNSDNLE